MKPRNKAEHQLNISAQELCCSREGSPALGCTQTMTRVHVTHSCAQAELQKCATQTCCITGHIGVKNKPMDRVLPPVPGLPNARCVRASRGTGNALIPKGHCR